MPDQIQSDESAQRLREVRARFDAAVADNPTADAELDFADHAGHPTSPEAAS